MDRDISLKNASGSSVCGAVAVLATEAVLKSQEYNASIAVSMLVLFGTIAIFIYPMLYTTRYLYMSP